MKLMKEIPAELQAELNIRNTCVNDAIANRRKFLEDSLIQISELQVGDKIYYSETGEEAGTVSDLKLETNYDSPDEQFGIEILYDPIIASIHGRVLVDQGKASKYCTKDVAREILQKKLDNLK